MITGVAEVSLSTTVFAAGILASDLSENVTFTSPLSATSIVVPAGSVGFAFSTSAFTFAFSSVVNWARLSTFVFAGSTNVVLSAIVSTTVVVASALTFLSSSFCVAFTTASFANLGVGTSHLPSEFTVVVFLVPSGNVTSIVAPFIPVPVIFSSSVSTVLITGAGVVGFNLFLIVTAASCPWVVTLTSVSSALS